jgi:hypothetical protein
VVPLRHHFCLKNSALEVEQLGNQDWPWSSGESLEEGMSVYEDHTLHSNMKMRSTISKRKGRKYTEPVKTDIE